MITALSVNVQTCIEEVIPEKKYQGFLIIGGVKIGYQIKFKIPISSISFSEDAATVLENIVILKLKRGRKKIQVNESRFFAFLFLVPIAIDFFLEEKNPVQELGQSRARMYKEEIAFAAEAITTFLNPEIGCTFFGINLN